MAKGYAYIDKGNILHIVGDEYTAIEYARGESEIIETELPHNSGYPFKKDKVVIIYGNEKNELKNMSGKLSNYPDLIELYNKCNMTYVEKRYKGDV